MNSRFKQCTIVSVLLAGLSLFAACGGGGGANSGPTPVAPGAFNLISPANNDTTTTQPTFKWNPASGAASYTVQIDLATNPSFSTLVYDKTNITTTSDTISGVTLTAGDSYIWRVIAVNSVGTKVSSEANSFTINDSGAVVWAVTSNPTGTGAEAFGMAINSGNIYTVGYDAPIYGDAEWRIEKRSSSDGSLLTFGTSGVVTSNPSNYNDDIYGVVTYGASVYAVGSDSGYGRWRIEKRSLSGVSDSTFGGGSGVVVSANAGPYNEAFSAATDGTYLYVVGYDNDASGKEEWRIEKRNLSDGLLTSGTYTDGYVNGVVTSATGTGLNEALAIAIDSTYMYVVGFDTLTALGNEQWRIEKRRLSDGTPDVSFGANGVISISPSSVNDDAATAIVIDTTYLYVAGYDSLNSANTEWRIEKPA